jgi:hypothetical protein
MFALGKWQDMAAEDEMRDILPVTSYERKRQGCRAKVL